MAEFKEIKTQEEFDTAIKGRLERAEKAVRDEYKDYADLKAKAEKYDTDLAAWNEEKEKLTKAKEKAESDFSALKCESMKQKVALECGLPLKYAERLKGTNEDELKKDAEGFITDFQHKGTPYGGSGEPTFTGKESKRSEIISDVLEKLHER